MENRMIYAGIAIGIILAAAFFMFRQKPAEIAEDAKLGLEAAKGTSENVSEDLKKDDLEKPMNDTNLEKPEMLIDSSKSYTAVLHTTQGDITVELTASATPITVNNFVYLARNNFYDNTIFHRVMEDFMIQGGDPTGTGAGGPGYRFDDEPFDGQYTRGAMAMANAGPNTNGSQFFIMHADKPLPKNYVIFGNVVKGLDAVDKIATADTTMNTGGENSKPVDPVKINSVEIIEQ